MGYTKSTKLQDIKRNWHAVDVKGKILGRVSTQIASYLIGKGKFYYVPYMDCGDFVVVTNASKVKVTGNKQTQKVYFRHSGFPGGDTRETFDKLIKRKPEEVIRHAVKGMLPKSKLGRKMIKKLFIFPGEQHKFEKQLGGALR